MSIIDDWLRQHPNLTLSRDQRETLEELIEEDYDDPSGFYDYGQGGDFSEDDRREGFEAGARAMRQSIAAEFYALDGVGSGVGDVIAGLAKFVDNLQLPEMPEED